MNVDHVVANPVALSCLAAHTFPAFTPFHVLSPCFCTPSSTCIAYIHTYCTSRLLHLPLHLLSLTCISQLHPYSLLQPSSPSHSRFIRPLHATPQCGTPLYTYILSSFGTSTPLSSFFVASVGLPTLIYCLSLSIPTSSLDSYILATSVGIRILFFHSLPYLFLSPYTSPSHSTGFFPLPVPSQHLLPTNAPTPSTAILFLFPSQSLDTALLSFRVSLFPLLL